MSQNLVSITFSDSNITTLDNAIGALENTLTHLIDLSSDQRRSLTKMGGKSEAFCRQALNVLAQNPHIVPTTLDLAEAQRDLQALDILRSRTARLRQLVGRLEDTELALGSDVMTASLDGYALLKVFGKGSGLETLRAEVGLRFAKNSTKAVPEAS
ncbi:MAG: hypothetical protein QM762_08340 [Chryseolinea sp.]